MTHIDYKWARENYVEHRLDQKAQELKLQGLNPTGTLFKKRMQEEKDKVSV